MFGGFNCVVLLLFPYLFIFGVEDFVCFMVLRIKSLALHMPGRHSTTELHPSPQSAPLKGKTI